MRERPISRRVVLGGGVLAIGLAVGGGLWRAVDQGVSPALSSRRPVDWVVLRGVRA